MKTATQQKLNTIRIPHTGGFDVAEVTIPGPYETMAQVRAANAAANYFYFEKGAMRFFRSRPAKNTIAGRFFIDSTQFVDSSGKAWPREYKVIVVTDDGKTHSMYFPNDNWDGKIRNAMDDDCGIENFKSRREAAAALKSFLERHGEQ